MQAKRYYLYFVMFSLILIISFSAGCKKSSSDNSNPVGPVAPANNNPLVGNWALSKITITNPDNSTQVATPDQVGFTMAWTFKTDNTYIFVITQQTGNTTQTGTYSYTNNEIALKDETNNARNYNLKLNGNVLTMPITLQQGGQDYPSLMEFSKK